MSTITSFDINRISPWPPTLNFTPEVQSGINACAELAFGPRWDTPMDELNDEEIVDDMLRLSPNIAAELMAFMFAQPA